jgi:hypothetical protein
MTLSEISAMGTRTPSMLKIAAGPEPKKDSSVMSDFMAGVEPTGRYTFEAAMRNKGNHGRHKAVSAAGGFIGGAAIIPGAISALALGVPKYLTAGKGRKLSTISQSALKPYRMLYHGLKGRREIKDIIAGKGKSTNNIEKALSDMTLSDAAAMKNMLPKKQINSIRRMAKHTPKEYAQRAVEHGDVGRKGEGVRDFMSWAAKRKDKKMRATVNKGVRDARREFVGKLKTNDEFAKSVKKSVNIGLLSGGGAIGLSGATNALSAVSQYNSGLKAQSRINKEQPSQ